MIILFDPSFPKSLLDALRLVMNIDKRKAVTIAYFDETIEEDTMEHPVVFLIDEARSGVDHQVRYHLESGYRVFVYKLQKGSKRSLSDIGMTVLSLFPKALEKIRSTQTPFVYSIRHKAKRLTPIRLKPLVEPAPPLPTSTEKATLVARTARRRPIAGGTLGLFD